MAAEIYQAMSLTERYGPLEDLPTDLHEKMQKIILLAYTEGAFDLQEGDYAMLEEPIKADNAEWLATLELEYRRAIAYLNKVCKDGCYFGHKFSREDQPLGFWNEADRHLSLTGAARFAKSVLTSQGMYDLSEKMAVERLEAVTDPLHALRAFGFPSVSISPSKGRSVLLLMVERGAYFRFYSKTADYYVMASNREQAQEAMIMAVGDDFEKAPLTVEDVKKLRVYAPLLLGEMPTYLDETLGLLQEVIDWWDEWTESEDPTEVGDPPIEQIRLTLKRALK